MGKGVKGKRPKWLSGRRLFFINTLLVLVPVAYLTYQPLLRYSASILVYSEKAKASDAIIVLAGGEPGRAWEAADLYREGFAPVVALTYEIPGADEVELRKHGIEPVTGHESYLRVLRGMRVPEENIRRVEPAVEDTFDELIRIRDFARKEKWGSLMLVTSNYHSRRTKMTADYLFRGGLEFTVVASRHGGFDPEMWWTKTSSIRTFVIEFEKLVAYTFYIWPRKLVGVWTSQNATKPSNSSSVSSASASTSSFSLRLSQPVRACG